MLPCVRKELQIAKGSDKGVLRDQFCYFCTKTYFAGAHWNCLTLCIRSPDPVQNVQRIRTTL